MANNCLVTKLKGVVNNNNLIKLGDFIFPKVRDDFDGDGANIAFQANQNMLIEDLDGNFYNRDYNKIYNTACFETIPPGHRIRINSKYNVTMANISFEGEPFNGETGRVKLKDLQYCTYLETISIPGMDITIYENVNPMPSVTSISFINAVGETSLSDIVRIFPNLNSLRFSANRGNITGSFVDISPLISLTEIQLGECKDVDGSIEDFVIAQKLLGRTSANIKCLYFKSTKITFNGESVSQEINTTNLIWNPNASNPSNTDVTYNGVTITI